MSKIRIGRFVLVMCVFGVILGALSAVVTRGLGIASSVYVGGGLGGVGVPGMIAVLNWLVRRGHFRWLERQ